MNTPKEPRLHVTRHEITKPFVAFPLIGGLALVGSCVLVIVRLPPFGPFIGYALAPLVVILAWTLVILQRNRHASDYFFEHELARRFIQALGAMAGIALIPAAFHSLQIARELTLRLAP